MTCVSPPSHPALASATSAQVLSAYGSYLHSTPESDLVNKYLTYSSSRYEPAVLVSSCPGDA